MNRLLIGGIVLWSFARIESAAAQAFVHPGCLSTQTDLDRIKAKVAANAQPWKAGYDALAANSHSQSSYTAHPHALFCRGGACAGMGLSEDYMTMANDAAAAYQCALRYQVTGDTAFADAAMRNMDAYSATLQEITGDSNALLALGAYGYQFACAAELLRNYRPWIDSGGFTDFQILLLTKFYPGCSRFLQLHNGTCDTHYWANWDLFAMDAILAIGVLCDSRSIYDEALDYYKSGIGNGAADKVAWYVHPGNLGQCQESGRDQGHCTLDPILLGVFCEIAWNQGDDMYALNNNVLLGISEYVCKYNEWNDDVPYVTYCNCDNVVQTTLASGSRGAFRPGYELIFNHYVNRRGLAAPYTMLMAMGGRPEGGGGNYGSTSGGYDQLGFTTLTHTLDPIAPVATPPPTGLTAEARNNTAVLSWWGSANASGYRVKRATSDGGPYTVLAAGLPGNRFTYTDSCLAQGTTYYYAVSAMLGAAETADSTPVSVTPNLLLSGTVVGSDGAYLWGMWKENAFDRALATYFDAANASGDWTGLDLGMPHVITQLGYCPRNGFPTRMVGGQFQGANVADFSSGVTTLFTVGTSPAVATITSQTINNPGAFRYVRYIGPANSNCNVAELRFYGYPNPAHVPAAPSGLEITAGNGKALLGWSAPSGAGGFNVKRATVSGGTYATVAANITSTTYVDAALANGTTYYYVVAAVNATGEGANSAEVSALPTQNSQAGGVAWAGTASGVWDTGTPNWQVPGALVVYQDGEPVLFDDTASMFATVTVSAPVTPAAVAFNNGSKSYSLSGSPINCPGSFVKTGGGSVFLGSSNIFAGGATLGGGKVTIQNAGSLGNGPVTLNGGTLCGYGNINFADNIVIADGGGAIQLGSANNLTLTGTISGSGPLTLGNDTNASSIYLSGVNAMTGGSVTVANNNNYVRFATTSAGNGNADWILNNTQTAHTTFDFPSGTVAFGSLSGSGTLQGNVNGTNSLNVTIQVGGNNHSATFSGIIHNNGWGTGPIGLTKTGTGNQTLTGASDYSGATTVNAGELTLASTFACNSSCLVNAAATLGVTNTSSSPATVNALTLAAGSTLEMNKVTSMTTPMLACGNVSANGACTVRITPTNAGIRVGSYPLVAYSGVFQGTFANLQLQLPAGVAGSLVNDPNRITLSVVSVPVPVAPVSVTAAIVNSQVELAWSASQYAESYDVWRSSSSGSGYVLVATTLGTTFTDTGAINSQNYYYVLTASNRLGTSSRSAETDITTLGAGRSAISINFQGGSSGNGTPSVMGAGEAAGVVDLTHWNNAGGASGSISALNDYTGSATTAAVNWSANNTWSTPITESAGNFRMMKGYLDTSNTSTTTVTVSGLPTAVTANGYTVYVYCDGDTTVAKNGEYTIDTTTIDAMDAGSTHYAGTFVQANNSAGNYVVFSDLTDASFTLGAHGDQAFSGPRAPVNGIQIVAAKSTAPLPDAPASLSATAVSSQQVDLVWTPSVGAASYNIKRSTASGGPYVTLATNVTATHYSDLAVSPLTLYHYVVSGVNASGEGAGSSEASAWPTYLMQYLKFDEASGATASDSSGKGRDAALVNGPTFAAGRFGNALVCTGASSQYAALPAGLVSTLDDITLSVWVKPATLDTWARVFDFGSGTATYMFLTTKNGSNGRPRFAIKIGGSAEQVIDASSALAIGIWTHIAVTLSGSTGILYLNGVASGSNNAITFNPSGMGGTTQNYLGKSQFADPYLNGALDDFRIYGRALTSGEIQTLATGQLAAPQNVATTAGASQIALSWTASSGATCYFVKRASASGGPYTIVGTTSATGYTDSGLTDGTTYYYIVTAISSISESAPSAEVSAMPLTLVQQWRLAHFGTSASAGTAADLADPDGDNLPNLLEYALGGNPLSPGDRIMPVIGRDGSNHATLTFNRIADPNLKYSVQATSDLLDWSTFWTSTGQDNTAGSVSITDPEPVSSHARRYLRLRVEISN